LHLPRRVILFVKFYVVSEIYILKQYIKVNKVGGFLLSVCGNCGAKIESEAKFCPECGAKQIYPSPVEKSTQPNFCVNCGAKVEPTAKFCEQCGTGVGTIQIAEPLSAGQRIESVDVIRILLAVCGLLPVLGIFVLNAFGILVFPIISFIAYFLYRGKGLNYPAKLFRNIGLLQVFGFIWFFIPFALYENIYGWAMVIAWGIVLPVIISLSAVIDTPLLVKKVGLEKPPSGSSGVWMKCKENGMQFLFVLPVYALINNMQRRELDWDNKVFVPLEPNTQHKIAVQYRVFGFDIARSRAFYLIQLSPNEIQNLEYEIRREKPYAVIKQKSWY
jgi:uncharacterized OB-fold protein